MCLKQIEEKTKNIPFCLTLGPDMSEGMLEDAHFNIRKPLMQMFGLKPMQAKLKSGKWTNGYGPEHMIPTDESVPIWQLKAGVDAEVEIDGAVKVISAKEIKNKQQEIDLIYDKDRISAKEVHDIQLLKASKRVKIPSNKSFTKYKEELEQKSSYIVIRAEVTQYLDHEGKLLDNPIESVVHYTTFPKLEGNT